MKNNYTVSVLQKAPSMNCDFYSFTGTYVDAVAYAQSLWMQFGQSVCLRTEADGEAGYWYHRIDFNGICTDRNTNSGVPETTKLTR